MPTTQKAIFDEKNSTTLRASFFPLPKVKVNNYEFHHETMSVTAPDRGMKILVGGLGGEAPLKLWVFRPLMP